MPTSITCNDLNANYYFSLVGQVDKESGCIICWYIGFSSHVYLIHSTYNDSVSLQEHSIIELHKPIKSE